MTNTHETKKRRQVQPDDIWARLDAVGVAPDSPVLVLLRQIRAGVDNALESLADEHEGNFRQSVLLIEDDAHRVATIVRTW